MENTYSIAVANKFLLALDESEDPLEVLQVRELEKEAKKKEKLSEKENKSKQSEAPKTAGTKPPAPKSRVIKETVSQGQPPQPAPKIQDSKKDQDKKLSARPSGGDRNVKFSGESREERNNRRNREDGAERTPRGQGEPRRTSGEGRDNREFRGPAGETQRGDFGERRGRGGVRGTGGGRGRGGSRGGRGGFDSRGKREFDRQSGSDKTHGYSGVKPVDKKEGAGSHNWGTHRDEIEESLNQENQDWSGEKPEGEAAPVPIEGKEGDAPADTSLEDKPAAEEESRELTLDEWKALRQNRAKPQYNLRKAGEGEDLSRWKKMYALEKKKEGAEEEEDEEEEYDAAAEYPQRVGRQKHVLDIEINFSDTRRGAGGGRGRGGRGGRGERANGRGFGGSRGGGAPRDGEREPREREPREPREPREREREPRPVAPVQMEQRSPRGRQNAPKVDDEHDFPSLG